MRILLVHNRYRSAQPSGENAVVDEEAELLQASGHDVERVEVDSDSIAALPAARRAAVPLQAVWSRSGSKLVLDAIDRSQPDVVHFHNTFPLLSPAAIRAAKQTGTPVVLTLHNFRPLCASGTFLRHGKTCELCLHRRAPVAALRYGCYRDSRIASAPLVLMSAVHRALGTWTDHVDAVVFPSRFARDKYADAGWPQEKLFVKHNTVRPLTDVRHGSGTGFVAISRLSSEKGLDVLIDAWRRAFPNGEETLTIIGSGEDEAALRQRADGQQSINFRGAQPPLEARAQLASARALVIPSRCYEVFPRTIAEAFAAGVPVIASRLGALAELIDDGATGMLVEPESVEGFAAALRHLSESPELAVELGAAAKAAYDTRFSPEQTTSALTDIYTHVLETR